jgi:circadian clock protein KaiC
MVGALTGMGVTVLSTVELPDSFTVLQFSPRGTAFLSDAIIMQRYLQIGGQLKRVISVVKVRGSQHT